MLSQEDIFKITKSTRSKYYRAGPIVLDRFLLVGTKSTVSMYEHKDVCVLKLYDLTKVVNISSLVTSNQKVIMTYGSHSLTLDNDDFYKNDDMFFWTRIVSGDKDAIEEYNNNYSAEIININLLHLF